MSRTLVKLLGLVKVYDQKGDRVSKNDNNCQICCLRQKGVFKLHLKIMGLCLYMIKFAWHLLDQKIKMEIWTRI